MIKSNELRLGNWVLRRKNSEPEQWIPTQINLDYLRLIMEDTFGDFKPIPLTEEILLKAGFEYIGHVGRWVKRWGRNGTVFIRFDKCYQKFLWEFTNGYSKAIEYIHQLQNGFHFHTGEEFQINL